MAARIVDVVLALHSVAHRLEQIGDGCAEGGVPAVTHVQGARRVRRYEFHLHRSTGAHERSAILPPVLKYPANFGVIGVLRQKEIDEAGAGNLDFGNRGARRQRSHQGLRQFARILAGRLGALASRMARLLAKSPC